METKITSRFQVSIPRAIRDQLKLKVADSIEWQVDGDPVYVTPTDKPFLQYRGAIKVGPGDVKEDIRAAATPRPFALIHSPP